MSSGESSTAWVIAKAVIALTVAVGAAYKGYQMHKEIEQLAEQRKETDKQNKALTNQMDELRTTIDG